MKETNWIRNTNEVTMWLNESDRGDSGKMIEMSITMGNDCGSDELRSTYWTAIRSIGSMFEDFPKARKGQASSLPEEVELNVNSVKRVIQNAFASISNADVVLNVILPHGRTGGAYEDINALADYFAGKAATALLAGYKEGRWDGTLNENNPQMTPPAVKGSDGGQEEE